MFVTLSADVTIAGRVRGLAFLAIAIGLGAAEPAAGAATSGFSRPPRGGVLGAGSTVPLSWSLLPGSTAGFEEMELVLSLDGGRTFPFRVTRELSPVTTGVEWCVPALSSRSARLALRAGNGGEPQEEEILLVSEEFAVETGGLLRIEPTVFTRGEWLTLEAAGAAEDSPEPCSSMHGESGPLVPGAHRSCHGKRAPRPAVLQRSELRIAVVPAVADAPRPAHPPSLRRVPADSPRRE